MSLLRIATWLHKWIGLIVGVQILFWVAGGVVMTVLPIEKVRGEHHLAETKPKPLPLDRLATAADAARRAGVTPLEAQVKATPRGPVWVFKLAEGDPVIVAADSGSPLPAMSPDEARTLAIRAYKGEGAPVSVRLLPTAPPETGKTGPLWRVDFDDAEKTTFYLSPQTAEVVSRRSDMWRFYDLFWRLHILDFESGEDFNHPLLIGAALVSLAVVITGFVLLWIRIGRDLSRLRPRASEAV